MEIFFNYSNMPPHITVTLQSIIKKASPEPSFPPLNYLFLDMLENRKKLKSGLEIIKPITIKKRIQPQPEIPVESLTNVPPQPKTSEAERLFGEPDTAPTSSPDVIKPSDIVEEGDPNYDDEEPMTEEEERDWILRKIYILRKKHRDSKLPEYDSIKDLPLETLRRVWEKSSFEEGIDRTVANYRVWLESSFVIMEFVCCNLLKIDLSNFAANQIAEIESYDSLLIELGEKHWDGEDSIIPVELRLLGFVLVKAAIFYIFKSIGSNIRTSSSGASNNVETMKGPSMRPEDIRKFLGKEKNTDSID